MSRLFNQTKTRRYQINTINEFNRHNNNSKYSCFDGYVCAVRCMKQVNYMNSWMNDQKKNSFSRHKYKWFKWKISKTRRRRRRRQYTLEKYCSVHTGQEWKKKFKTTQGKRRTTTNLYCTNWRQVNHYRSDSTLIHTHECIHSRAHSPCMQ